MLKLAVRRWRAGVGRVRHEALRELGLGIAAQASAVGQGRGREWELGHASGLASRRLSRTHVAEAGNRDLRRHRRGRRSRLASASRRHAVVEAGQEFAEQRS